MSTLTTPSKEKKRKSYASNQEVRWCPGCGDYTILKQVQTLLPTLGVEPENIAFVAGIGCSSRFPYYMDTYGIHGIHGRAPAIATGLKTSRPDLSVWVITGDGDGLSIGGNHLIHSLRRNIDLNILLFNNEIYGLTKGQYSPTSQKGHISKSSPQGSLDNPFNPLSLALGSRGTFLARTMDRDPKHLQKMLERSYQHKGTSLLEIYQNCIVFNDGAFEPYTNKATRNKTSLYLQQDQPLLFGENNRYGVRLDGLKPVVVDLQEEEVSADELWIHDESDKTKAWLLTTFFENNFKDNLLPRPFGVLYSEQIPTYEEQLQIQIEQAKERHGKPDLEKLLKGNDTWVVR
ncbi:2-oxoacid:ferredoxin oxidoreductase subunit beta [Balneolaceae bacterium ANBcel3]|nr:2-oxoacid:ferredoxin oxidoreductase subunit beta [Balneolaceae bacterium ANBcel3]